jgi:penicillin-binding protein 1C
MMNSQNHDEEKQIPDEESVEQSLGQTGRRPDFDTPKRPDWMREHAQAGDTNLDGYTGFSSIKDSLAQTDNLFDELKDFDYFDVPVVSPGDSVPTFTGNMGDHDLDEMTAQNVPDKAQIPPAEQAIVRPGEYTQSDMDEMRTIPPPAGVPVAPPPASALPQAVSQLDPYATRLTPTAFQRDLEAASVSTQPVPVQIHQTQPIAAVPPARNVPSAPSGAGKKPKKKGRAGRVILILIILFLLAMFAVAAFAFYKYTQIAKTLPDVNDLQYRASQFETTRILDRKGNVLYEIIDPSAGKRTWVPLDQISPNLIAATIATEDKEFYNHPGFDLVALGRALWTNYRSKEVVSGASTITQQLARLLLLTDERYEQTYERKAREIILAAEITRRYSKEQVLEMYLNEIYYGNMSYGVQAAAETYFNTNASDLSLWQAAFLAGLPQSPAVYDVYNNREATLTRSDSVFRLMFEASTEKGCIKVDEIRPPVCVDAMQVLTESEVLKAYTFKQNLLTMQFPHWVVYIQSLLEAQFDAQMIYRSGFTIHTTLDPDFQREAEAAVREQLAQMQGKNATNGAVFAINPKTGEILAMVGSADFNNPAISGQVNMVLTQTRQPGSAIKPFTFLAAFEKDWTPATLLWDVPTRFRPSLDPNDTNPDYEPRNYDGRFRGPVTVRSALANSYNIPVVKALEYVHIYDNPETPEADGFINLARRLGITSLTRPDYGLSLTLGGGEVSLMELTGAFQVLANEGRKLEPVAITRVVNHTGDVVFEHEPSQGAQIVRAAHAYLLSSILSDNNARAPMFGTNSPLNLPFSAAVKTGTTNDFRDNWTIGYTPELLIGVWVGNADYTPMVNTTGVDGAAPIWNRLMQTGINQLYGGIASNFARPNDVVERVICSVSGTEPSEYCPSHVTEIFASDQMPLPKSDDLWVRAQIDAWTNLQASPSCSEFRKEALAINVTDKSAIEWLETEPGREWARNAGFPEPIVVLPERECRADDPRPIINLVGIYDGGTVTENPLKIAGVIDATANFKQFIIHWGVGEDPEEWHRVTDDWVLEPIRSESLIAEWDLSEIEETLITIRVTMHSTMNTEVQKFYRLRLEIPTPTPTPTLTPTETPMPTETPAPPQEPTIVSP